MKTTHVRSCPSHRPRQRRGGSADICPRTTRPARYHRRYVLRVIVAATAILTWPWLVGCDPLVDGARAAARHESGNAMGVDQLAIAQGPHTPTGAGVVVGMVEAKQGGRHRPDVTRPQFAQVRMDVRDPDGDVSEHATAVASMIVGDAGLAPGVTHLQCESTSGWKRRVLRLGENRAPQADQVDVFTHSWVGLRESPATVDALRRIDEMIDRQDVLVIAGVNNDPNSAVPVELASAWNVIAVGQWDGQSSGGGTVAEGVGRMKPDVVAPGAQTSVATPAVAAMAARLLEASRQLNDPLAIRSETLKAVLMAGCDKPADWLAQPGRPLDDHYGAGRVRIDASVRMMNAGRAMPSQNAADRGWAFVEIADDQPIEWPLHIDTTSRLSVVATWHRRIAGMQQIDNAPPQWIDAPRIADFGLRLESTTQPGNPIAMSDSVVDNIEHLHLPRLPAGDYRLTLWRNDTQDEPWDVAVAWRLDP